MPKRPFPARLPPASLPERAERAAAICCPAALAWLTAARPAWAGQAVSETTGHPLGPPLALGLLAILGLLIILLLAVILIRGRNWAASRASEERYRRIVEAANEGVMVMDANYRATFVNRALAGMLGYEPEEILGRPVDDFIFLADAADHASKLDERKRGHNQKYERRLLRKDGGEVWVIVSATALRAKDGSFAGSIAMTTDISERRQAEQALRQVEARQRLLLDTMVPGVTDIDAQGRITYANPAYCRMQGYTEQELLGMRVWEMMAPGPDRDGLPAYFELLLRDLPAPTPFFANNQRKDGSRFPVRVDWSYQLGPDGRATGFTTLVYDITEQVRAETELRQSEEKLRVIFGTIQSGIILVDSGGKILFANSRMGQMLGRDAAELVGSSYLEHTDGAQTDEARDKMFKLIRGDIDHVYLERLYKRKDGSTFWGHLSGKRLENPDGSFMALVGDIQDIDERKRAELALRESEARFRATFEQLAVGMVHSSLDGRFRMVNQRLCDFLGYSAEELAGMSFQDVSDPEDGDIDARQLKRLMAGEIDRHTREKRYRRKDGSVVWGAVNVSLVRGAAGEPQYYVAVVEDINEKRLLESQLLQSQKMEAIGTLAGGIAHDFNNILTAILGYAELAQETAAQGQDANEELGQIIASAQRARDLVRQILTFSRKMEPELRRMDLNEEVKHSIALLAHTLPKMISIHQSLAPAGLPVNADPTQISQVIINLAANALQAMPEGGELTITTEDAFVDALTCATCGETFSGKWALLTVSDTGHGIDPAHLVKIFDPFFTTKGVGQGTGLGLSMVHGIVQGHGGHVICESQLGLGATFNIYLPGGNAQTGQSPAGEAPSETAGGSETLLLVDDEEPLRKLGARMLTSAGYRVVTAKSGEEALDIYRERGAAIDLVVMDLGMPGMGGSRCIREVRAIDPQAKVIIASGYAAQGQGEASQASGVAAFVAKPYRRAALLATVRAVLDGGQPPAQA